MASYTRATTTAWPPNPMIYEINTWVWLQTLSEASGTAVTLDSVPDRAWDDLAEIGMDAVWLMGVWERSPAGREIALENPNFQRSFIEALPGYQPEDISGSPYCVRQYQVDPALGGPKGLQKARQALEERGLRLILDYVPNHVAPDHPWTERHPEFFIRGSDADLATDSASFVRVGDAVLACGRDPFFPAWPDVVQLNAFEPRLRQATIATLRDIASQCDGVRCDMSMLLINSIFADTWGERAGNRPELEFWREVIPAVKETAPEFRFIAEAYWDLEWELQQQGFDYCYDKLLYDRLVHDDATAVRGHLWADMEYQRKLLRFIENHDEPRAAATFAPGQLEAATVVETTLPGGCLIYDGQRDARRVRLPVLLGRQPDEPDDPVFRDFTGRLLLAIQTTGMRNGDWKLCATSGWPDNQRHNQLLAWTWKGQSRRSLVVVNYASEPAQGIVHLSWDDISGAHWTLTDRMSDAVYERDGHELDTEGLYVELAGWGHHVLQFSRV
ncbi:MAG TPA: alpha-amylase family glycosyl hydrolase [Thermomicrobiales bacterium]|nr:alpha-amylase family glycosyl hydrolase [Thermomicrobiales bacterium]